MFPYNLHGDFSNLDGSLDWEPIQKQVAVYYMTNNGKDLINKTISDTIHNQLKNSSGDIQKGVDNLVKNIFH